MWQGHMWTLSPFFASLIRPPAPPPSRHFHTWARDPALGKVGLTGRWTEIEGATDALVVVHGLGGSARSPYNAAAALAAAGIGLSSLRLNLRGADLRGEDYYHAGLTDDLAAAIASPELARYERIFVLGYSLGGHVALRYATEPRDPRVAAVAAVCPPLDLAAAADEIDKKRRTLYRAHMLRGLKAMYRRVAARRDVPVPLADALAIGTIREWDDRIIAPRHGFADADDYWTRVGVASRLHMVDVPTLVIQSEADPMVLAHTVRPTLDRAPAIVRAIWIEPHRGGHVGFASDLDLGLGAALGLEAQVLAWLTSDHEERAATAPAASDG